MTESSSATNSASAHVSGVPWLPVAAASPCACPPGPVRVVAVGERVAAACGRCGEGRLLVRANDGVKVLALDVPAQARMVEALRVWEEGSFVEAGELAVGRPDGPVSDIVWGAWGARPGLVEELVSGLSGGEGQGMFLCFRLIATMSPVPEDVGRALAAAVPRLRLLDRAGAGYRWFLQAAYAAAPWLGDVQADVRRLGVPSAHRDAQAADLRALHRAAWAAICDARIDRDVETLVAWVVGGAWSEVAAMLPAPPACVGGGQSWVDRCERAGDRLADAGRPTLAARCYGLAIQQAEPVRRAITGGGAGLAWRDMIRRLEEKRASALG